MCARSHVWQRSVYSGQWLCWNVKSFGVVSLRDSRKSVLGVSCTSAFGRHSAQAASVVTNAIPNHDCRLSDVVRCCTRPPCPCPCPSTAFIVLLDVRWCLAPVRLHPPAFEGASHAASTHKPAAPATAAPLLHRLTSPRPLGADSHPVHG
jgi:hypothetical protein